MKIDWYNIIFIVFGICVFILRALYYKKNIQKSRYNKENKD